MIPQSIKREHVLQAIDDIRAGGVPKKREPTKFNLVHEGRLYPPKFALSLAAKHAIGEELPASTFSGGNEARHATPLPTPAAPRYQLQRSKV